MAGNRHHGIRIRFIGSLCGGIGPGGLALNDAPKCALRFLVSGYPARQWRVASIRQKRDDSSRHKCGFESRHASTHPGWCEAEQVQVGKPDSRKGQPDETEARNQRHHPLSL